MLFSLKLLGCDLSMPTEKNWYTNFHHLYWYHQQLWTYLQFDCTPPHVLVLNIPPSTLLYSKSWLISYFKCSFTFISKNDYWEIIFHVLFFINVHIYLCETYLKGNSVAAFMSLTNVLSTPTSSKDFLLVNLFVLPITNELFQISFCDINNTCFSCSYFPMFSVSFLNFSVICVQIICNFQIYILIAT